MASPAELSLACGQPNNYSSAIQNIEDFLANLQEERNKIEAFKRELPLCMQLINNAHEVYNQQLETYRTTRDLSDKANWMVSAQLWSPAADVAKQAPPPKETEKGLLDELALDGNSRSGSAFLPFSKEKNCRDRHGAPKTALPELALASPEEVVVVGEESERSVELESGGREGCSYGRGAECGKRGSGGSSHKAEGQAAVAHRKVRRCWSPDLHRRFVGALQILGGSQVATPKQIRELMKVDGLTNDEVKSHLQKYRLHTRRPPPAPQIAAAAVLPPKVVVLGGIWVQPEYAAQAAAGPAIYGSHPAPPAHFYTPSTTMPHHLHPPVHLATVCGGGGCKGRDSPESEGRSDGERSEIIRGEEKEQEESTQEEKIGGELRRRRTATAAELGSDSIPS